MAKKRRVWTNEAMDFGFKIDSPENVKKAVKMCMNVPLMLGEAVEAGVIEITYPTGKEVEEEWERRRKSTGVESYERVWLQSLLRAAVKVGYPPEPLYNKVMEELPLCPVTTDPVIYPLSPLGFSPEWRIHKYYEYGKLCEKYGLRPGMFTEVTEVCDTLRAQEQKIESEPFVKRNPRVESEPEYLRKPIS